MLAASVGLWRPACSDDFAAQAELSEGKHPRPDTFGEPMGREALSLAASEAKLIHVINTFKDGKPFWMTLQIAYSGTTKPGRVLRMPTFPEQRFMAYQAIINGARGLVYFGGGLPQTFNERDKRYGYNWTYFDRIMKPLLEEISPKSPLVAALVAPDSKLKVTVAAEAPAKRAVAAKREETAPDGPEAQQLVQDESSGESSGIEFVVRKVGNDVYILACKREGPTVHDMCGSQGCRRSEDGFSDVRGAADRGG